MAGWLGAPTECAETRSVFVSPDGFRLLQHDGLTGLSSDGRRTKTRWPLVQVLGSRLDASWQEAVGTILAKLCEKGACRLLASESFNKAHIGIRRESSLTRTAEASSGNPLRTLSSAKRGLRIEAMGFAVNRSLRPNSSFTSALADETAGTSPRSTSNAFADWCRDGT